MITRPYVALLDDDVALCVFMSEVAQAAGYHTLMAHDGRELATLLAAQPVLLVLDIAMAHMDGIEVIRQLAAARFTGRLVIVSGHGAAMLQSAKLLAELQDVRVAGILTKPIRAESLLALLQAPELRVATPRVQHEISQADLARGIENNELLLHYQPQVRLTDGAWVGVEALVRWQHPQHGLLYPDAFIALAESSGLALPLTRKVIAMALQQCSRGCGTLKFTGTLSINLPPIAMSDLTFPEAVEAAVNQVGCKAEKIMFEVTETSVPADPAKAIEILTRLRLKGFALSIDDFGTGHSSLENLQHLPFNELKIDLIFVRAAETDVASRLIVESSIALGCQLGMKVLAEGVENQALWHWLRNAGCDLAQGYFIARPMPLEQLAAWQGEWETRRLALI
ncbi:MAG: EAL domain-containing response regulator [Rhodoferax sp.]|uniref:EAL domain-containing response regulator n=1 Tax=Rhodoferax sp. TaxID=50421 RepID=UPI00261EEAAB|nr:EAL domain-containing response regulator [Rhodoferax sp.]MDD2882782.1 EAL domain-containing response regulator [Rhodoferax sp.]